MAIAAGPDGNVWFIEVLADKLGSINPTTHVITEYPLSAAVVGEATEGELTAGPDGNLWLAPVLLSRGRSDDRDVQSHDRHLD